MRVGFIALLIAFFAGDTASAFQRIVRYPRVYGATGHPYGPTQAHYQYQRQYGHPWHGYGGSTAVVSRSRRVYLPYSYSPLAAYGPVLAGYYYGYGGLWGVPAYPANVPLYGYYPAGPLVPAVPQVVAPPFFNNAVMNGSLLENDLRWNQPLQLTPVPDKTKKPVPANTAAVLRSLRAQSNGDFLFQRQEYHRAYGRYQKAVREAPERAEAQFRLAFTLTALGLYDSAVAYFKRGLRRDPKWPVNGASLGRIFGRQNQLAKTAMLGRVTRWVRQDIRDPDRLFLLGVLLHFDNHMDKSAVLFETAYRLAGSGDHLKAFLLAGSKLAKPKAKQAVAAVKKAPAPKPAKPAAPQGPILPPLPTQ